MREIIIRDALTHEVGVIYDLLSKTDSMHRKEHPDLFQQVEFPENTKDYYRSCILSTKATILVAENSGEIIGAIICSIQAPSENPVLVHRKYACIENIFVSPPYRRHGIGCRLMESAQKWASRMDASTIELTVWEFNREPMEFYSKLGYQVIHRRMRKAL